MAAGMEYNNDRMMFSNRETNLARRLLFGTVKKYSFCFISVLKELQGDNHREREGE